MSRISLYQSLIFLNDWILCAESAVSGGGVLVRLRQPRSQITKTEKEMDKMLKKDVELANGHSLHQSNVETTKRKT